MKAIAEKIACWCSECDEIKEAEFEAVVYGLELIFGTILKYIILLGIGCLINRGLEFSIILTLIAVFRAFAGGVHGRTSVGCFLYMLMVCVVSVGLAELSANLEGFIVPGLGFLICLYTVYRYAPLQSLKNPVRSARIIKRKRAGALLVAAGCIVLFITIDACIKWVFLYPLIIEAAAIMLESRKRRGLS